MSPRERDAGRRARSRTLVLAAVVTGVVAGLAPRWHLDDAFGLDPDLGVSLLALVGLSLVAQAITLRRPDRSGVRPGSCGTAGATGTPRILVVSASVGAGHDGVATELVRRARVAGHPADVVDFLELLPLGVGRVLRSAYRWQLKLAPVTWGWVLPLLDSRGGSALAALSSRLCRRRLLAACTPEPCLVVSTYPLASQALSRLRLAGTLAAPVVTFLTDMGVHALWAAPGVDAHLALHEVPAEQARVLGARGVEVVGPVVRPGFRPRSGAHRRDVRRDLGLSCDRRLALVVAGSWGVGDISRTVDDLVATGLVLPVVVCGTNQQLLMSLADRDDVVALGWVVDMPGLMAAADVVVQNAGGLTSLEARQSGLPVVTYRSLPGHGTTNNRGLHEAGWAPWAHGPGDLSRVLVRALEAPPVAAVPGEIPWLRLSPRLTPVPA